jgi:hypothetical protein
MTKGLEKLQWSVPTLDKVEMAHTRITTGGCNGTDTGSKRQPGLENPAANCSAGS